MIATHLTEVLGKTVIVDNRTGAEGIIGTEIAVMAVPDGCTLLVTADPTITINPSVYLKPPYNAIRDLPAITQLIGCAYVVVLHPSVAAAPGAPELRLSFFCLSASSQQAVINF
jgi:tripartite-type tricarboxylate transporter receptor subunit TctC